MVCPGYSFLAYGAHCDHYATPYLTMAAALGQTRYEEGGLPETTTHSSPCEEAGYMYVAPRSECVCCRGRSEIDQAIARLDKALRELVETK